MRDGLGLQADVTRRQLVDIGVAGFAPDSAGFDLVSDFAFFVEAN